MKLKMHTCMSCVCYVASQLIANQSIMLKLQQRLQKAQVSTVYGMGVSSHMQHTSYIY
jgi:hypothetical protein